MTRAFAQIAAAVFVVCGVGGFFTGDAGHVVAGHAGGNFDGVALHLTYLRDVIDLLLAAAFAYAGWVAPSRTAIAVTLGAGAFLLLLAIVGFVISDDAAGTRSVVTLHFTLAMNVLDLVGGTLAVLCALGDLGAPEGAAA